MAGDGSKQFEAPQILEIFDKLTITEEGGPYVMTKSANEVPPKRAIKAAADRRTLLRRAGAEPAVPHWRGPAGQSLDYLGVEFALVGGSEGGIARQMPVRVRAAKSISGWRK